MKILKLILRSRGVLRQEGLKGFFRKTSDYLARQKILPEYSLWMLFNEPTKRSLKSSNKEISRFKYQPTISIITPVFNTEKRILDKMIRSVYLQTYSNWELCLADGGSAGAPVKQVLEKYSRMDSRIKVTYLNKNLGIAGNSQQALNMATGDYVGFLDHDDTLAPFALFEIVKRFNEDNQIDFLYSDSDNISPRMSHRYNPYFKPEWSPDTLLSYNYIGHFAVIRKKLIDEIGGFREGFEGSQDYDLFLRVIEKTDKIVRIPKVLYHWRTSPASVSVRPEAKLYAYVSAKNAISDFLLRQGKEAEVMDGPFLSSYRVKYKIRPHQTVSIIIPTKDKVNLLQNCISSILNKTSYKHFEIIIVDNQSVKTETHDYYQRIRENSRIKIIKYNQSFNYSTINNFAAKSVKSDHFLFLNNDTEVISEEWLTAMLEFSQRSDVGAVGAKLYYSDDTIQHAGVIIGIKGIAGHSHKYISRKSNGYMGRLVLIQNVSAVTGACMMVPRKVFEEVSGFNEEMPISYNDIDLCLKIRKRGYKIIFTPYAELYHFESQSRLDEGKSEKGKRVKEEFEYFQKKWKNILEKGDPYYNPNLTLEREDFSYRL